MLANHCLLVSRGRHNLRQESHPNNLFVFADPSGSSVLSLSGTPVSNSSDGTGAGNEVRILESLDEEPAHGYLLAEKLDLSHGYIYTHLKELRDEGMMEILEKRDGKKVYGLTKSGKYLLMALTDPE